MDSIAIDRFRQTLLDLFTEACEGPAADWVWFVTHGDPNAGLFGTLARLTADEASTPPYEGGHTIAAHAEHLRWSLNMVNTYYRGEVPGQNWEQSWSVQTVDEDRWRTLQAELREQYRTPCRAIERHTDFADDTFLHGTMAIVPHAAYHLGAIRQLARLLQGPSS